MACPRCSSRRPQQPFNAVGTGGLYSWSTVSRSLPGVPVPFVSAIVDLDQGLTLEGMLRDAASEDLAGGLPARIVFGEVAGTAKSAHAPCTGHYLARR